MNIFLLDQDLSQSAKCHMDSHINKIPIEINQMLATALSIHSDKTITKVNGEPYSPCFHHHPCTKWVALNRTNFLYACELNLELCQENDYRHNRRFRGVSATLEAIGHSDVIPNDLPNGLFPIAINEKEMKKIYQLGFLSPKEYMAIINKKGLPLDKAIMVYRAYYNVSKTHLASWSNRNTPEWYYG